MQSNDHLALPAYSRLLAALSLFIAAACAGDVGGAAATHWEPVGREDLSDSQAARLDQLVDARNELASSLFAELSAAIQSKGHVEAISLCQERAPGIAKEVGAKHQVRIGRTSMKLRNPGNGAPAWAAELMDSTPEEKLMAKEGELRALFPIVLAGACLACHGPGESLAEGVADALAQGYPEDRATGYAEGDLRGWFWIDSSLQ